MKELRQYLYIDKIRVSSYFDQISGSSVITEKIPFWKTSIGISKIGTELSSSIKQREPAITEKIEKIDKYLRINKIARKSKDCMCPANSTQFAYGNLNCKKVTIQSNENSNLSGRSHLTLWISEKVPVTYPSENIKLGRLYLIESSTEEDVNGVDGRSAFGALRFLLELEYTKKTISNLVNVNEVPLFLMEYMDSKTENSTIQLCRQFDEDPIKFLSNIGAQIGDSRLIRTLYRRRFGTYGSDYVSIEFGYPIYIIEG